MEKDFLVQLTKKLYHLTMLFPKKEPLRYKVRELALDILQKPDEKDLIVLTDFFEIAKDQNWVKAEDILAVQSDYANIVQELASQKTLHLPKAEDKKIETKFQPLTAKTLLERHEKIMSILKEKGRSQVWEMKQVFPQVSKRTLRRDFEFLLKQGVIQRIGERNNTFYQVKVS
jgi:hypothetical protein